MACILRLCAAGPGEPRWSSLAPLIPLHAGATGHDIPLLGDASVRHTGTAGYRHVRRRLRPSGDGAGGESGDADRQPAVEPVAEPSGRAFAHSAAEDGDSPRPGRRARCSAEPAARRTGRPITDRPDPGHPGANAAGPDPLLPATRPTARPVVRILAHPAHHRTGQHPGRPVRRIVPPRVTGTAERADRDQSAPAARRPANPGSYPPANVGRPIVGRRPHLPGRVRPDDSEAVPGAIAVQHRLIEPDLRRAQIAPNTSR